MEKLEVKKEQEAKTKKVLHSQKSKKIEVDMPRLSCDYLDETLQIA